MINGKWKVNAFFYSLLSNYNLKMLYPFPKSQVWIHAIQYGSDFSFAKKLFLIPTIEPRLFLSLIWNLCDFQ